MHILKDICNNLEYQLEDVIKKGDMTPSELDLVYKSVKTIYYIKTINAMEEYTDDGYSRTYDGRSRDMMYDNNRSYESGYSNRGRGRDSMGRYRDSERDGVMGELNEMMNKANSDIERQTIAKIMDRIR